MPKYRLHSICPACGQGSQSYWYHTPSSCCKSNGWIYIWDDLDLSCDECGTSSCSFITNWKFKCGKHNSHDGYKQADAMKVMHAIGLASDDCNIPYDVRKKMINTLNSML